MVGRESNNSDYLTIAGRLIDWTETAPSAVIRTTRAISSPLFDGAVSSGLPGHLRQPEKSLTRRSWKDPRAQGTYTMDRGPP